MLSPADRMTARDTGLGAGEAVADGVVCAVAGVGLVSGVGAVALGPVTSGDAGGSALGLLADVVVSSAMDASSDAWAGFRPSR
ncbi:hypothetical protein [Kineosporia babensis]|uniref:Uncharacterized protein n=1 Tax=Kineosporia babensis TaxID=499548 RepID=A0A9X1N8X4_9ACTN|nr:hypothetical protein [Kineosporia babensis]MCD5309315.1 hypothetical protein [Kineosporia babensis]